MSLETPTDETRLTVLLVDDQPLIGEAVRRMLAGEPDIAFHYCKDGTRAVAMAAEVGPTVILQDLVMPEVDGLDLVRAFRADEATRDTPLIVLSTKEEPAIKAEAFALGANDYLVKLPDRIEVLARIRYHSRAYINLLQRNEAYRALVESQRVQAEAIAQAAKYVKSLLPEPLTDGDIRADWRFIPSTDLGGDTFNYHPLDDDHFAFYLLDVCGHGVGAALLSVSALNALRSQSLPLVDFRDPGQVVGALNRAFPMDQQDGKFFTIWYGVYNRPARRILYCGGGHPPALLLTGPTAESATLHRLESSRPMIGAIPDLDFETESIPVDAYAKLFLYCDGAFEIHRPDGSIWPFEAFIEFMAQPVPPEISAMDRLIAHTRGLGNSETYLDDFSIVEFDFLPSR